MSKDTVFDKQNDKVFQLMAEYKASKAPINTLSKLHRPEYVPPKLLHRPTYDFAEGVTARSMYDGELA